MKILKNAHLIFPQVASEASNRMSVLEHDGIASHCSDVDDLGFELSMGLDIGTSCAKVVIADESMGNYFPVNFYDNKVGIDQYLLSTQIFLSHGTYSLEPSTQEDSIVFSNIKLTLMRLYGQELETHDEHAKELIKHYQNHLIAYIALLIRYCRAWLFTENYDLYSDGTIFWRYVIGVPSDFSSETLLDVWKETLRVAVIVSTQEGPVTDKLINRSRELELDEDMQEIEAYPELVAEASALKKNHPIAGSDNFYLVDVGSGTLDILYMNLSQNKDNFSLSYATSCANVQPLGTYNCHLNRLNALENAFTDDQDCSRKQEFLDQIRQEKSKTFMAKLPDSFDDYFDGITFRESVNPDPAFAEQIFNNLTHVRFECYRHSILSTHEVNGSHIVLCGGGGRSAFYRDSLLAPELAKQRFKNHSWLRQPDLREMSPITDLTFKHPIHEHDHDRLIVAYGLATCIMTEGTLMNSVPERKNRSYEENYISQDMM